MIGPRLRTGLRWAAVIYVLYGLVAAAGQIVEAVAQRGGYAVPWWQFPMMSLGALVSAAVQAGVLLALLSIDERLERRP